MIFDKEHHRSVIDGEVGWVESGLNKAGSHCNVVEY